MTTNITAARTPAAQHVLPCPACARPAAVHVCLDGAEPSAIRVVCSAGCVDTDVLRVAAVDALYPPVANTA
jgi:hypothetical protein